MLRKCEIEAKNEHDARIKAKEQLKVSEEKIQLTVIKEKKGILGFGASVTYEATVQFDILNEVRQYIQTLLADLEITKNVEIRTNQEENRITISLETPENPLLIGREGRTLEAITTLVKDLVYTYTEESTRLNITVDIGNYRQTRIKQLEVLATKIAKEVARTKVPAKLNAMNSFERRIIHTKLSEWRDVYTESEGTAEERAIVIKPKYKK